MSLTRKSLAFGQLPAAKGDLYTPSGSTKGLVHNILLHNTNVTAEVVEIFYHDGSNEYRLWCLTLDPNETVALDFGNEGEVIENGGKYTGNTDTAAKVTYKINGTEEG